MRVVTNYTKEFMCVYGLLAMNGSYSSKYILPALVPEFGKSYKKLDGVQNESQTMNAFANISKIKEAEKQKMRTSLREYCKLDT